MSTISLNRFVLKPYNGDRALKSKNEGGFAIVQQKVSVVGLELLADIEVPLGNTGRSKFFSRGSIVYVKEELLFTQPWALKVYESDAIEGKFIIVDPTHIEFVRTP